MQKKSPRKVGHGRVILPSTRLFATEDFNRSFTGSDFTVKFHGEPLPPFLGNELKRNFDGLCRRMLIQAAFTAIGGDSRRLRVIHGDWGRSPYSSFGQVQMIDNALTEGPDMTLKQVGRCQGFYASAAQQDLGLLMTMNVVLTEGRYNGSTLSIMSWNPVFHTVREMPVVGGSVAFRMARGYFLLRIH